MPKLMTCIAATVLTMGAALHAQDLSGNWQGTLETGKGLRTIIKVTKDDGKLKATLYSIDQGANPFPMTTISLQGTAVNFTIKPIDLSYTGVLSPDGKAITGSATQSGQTHALNLQRVTAEAMWAIPEPPKSMPAGAHPVFDVVTIKPSDPNRPGKAFTVRGRHVMTINTNVNDLVMFAYGVHSKEIINAPAWFATDKFDLDGVPDIEGQPSLDQLKELMRSALTDRFKLTFHKDQQELSVYALTVSKSGPKMTLTASNPSDAGNFSFRGLGDLTVGNLSMQDFCAGMQSAVMDKPVVDHTGLTGRYDFHLKWSPDDSQFVAMGAHIQPPNPDDPNAPPNLYTALQEQAGLKLEATRSLAPVMVIDHIEKPSAN